MAHSNSCKSNSPLIAIALFLIVAMLQLNTAHSQSINFVYDFYGDQPTTLTYEEDAHFPSDTTFLRLTKTDSSGKALPSSVGRVLYSDSFPFWNSNGVADLETTIKFIVKPNPGDIDPADGIAFFIAPSGVSFSGTSGANFGIFGQSGNFSSVFAVEFDTYVNGAWDPPHRHIGIDIESRVSVNTVQVPDEMLGQELTLRVNYVGATKTISAVVSSTTHRSEVSYVYDLTTILPQQVQVGISASTGANVAIHDVVSWYLTSTLVSQGAREKGIRQLV